MYLSCLKEVNELSNVSTANRPIFRRFYLIKKTFLQLILNLPYRSCLHQVNKLQMIPNLIFYQVVCLYTSSTYCIYFLLGSMSLYLIHLLHIFCIKLFSPSEIIFTNDEHVFIHILDDPFHLFFVLFDLYEKQVTKGMSKRI